MRSTLKAICFIAALLAGLGASAAAASPVLSAQRMSSLRGGCGAGQKYCYSYWCGSNSPCDQIIPENICFPEGDVWRCNTIYQEREAVTSCISTVYNDYPCTQGASESCGKRGTCFCYKPSELYEVWSCTVINTTRYSHIPCVL